MIYLTRPVFEFDVNWNDPAAKAFQFDLRELLIGFGAEFFTGLQSHVAQGWQFSLLLKTAAEIELYEAFTAELAGRLNGFWLPTPLNALRVVAPVDATHVDIEDQNLRDTLADHPDVYFWLAGQPCKVTAAALQSAGIERITVQSALSPQPAAGDRAQRLHYVRLVDDQERGTFLKESTLPITLRCVELPTEYAAIETGQQPIYLYHFWTTNPMSCHWRHTSFAADVVSDNVLYSKYAITHGAIRDSTVLENRTLEIKAKYDASHPFALFLPIPFSRPLLVEVSMVSYGTPDTATILFSGQIRNVRDFGDRLTATCDDFLGVLSRKFPRMMIQPECNYHVFEPNTCKLGAALFSTVAHIASLDNASRPPTAVVTLDYPLLPGFDNWRLDGWFDYGWAVCGYGLEYEVRTILFSEPDTGAQDIKLTLNAPWTHAAVGDRVQITPGCNGLAATCQNKFNNFSNFGGFPAVPEQNLSLKAMNEVVSQGGKK